MKREGMQMELSGNSSQEFEVELGKVKLKNETLRKRIAFLEKMTEFDEATHLLSQSYFERRFAQELRRAERYCEFLSLVLIDTSSVLSDQSSKMKARVLEGLGNLIGDTIRATDILTSLGKGRLVLLLTETPKEGALRLAKRLSEKIARTTLPEELKLLKDGVVNVGIASFPEDGGDREDLLQVASSPLNSELSVMPSVD